MPTEKIPHLAEASNIEETSNAEEVFSAHKQVSISFLQKVKASLVTQAIENKATPIVTYKLCNQIDKIDDVLILVELTHLHTQQPKTDPPNHEQKN